MTEQNGRSKVISIPAALYTVFTVVLMSLVMFCVNLSIASSNKVETIKSELLKEVGVIKSDLRAYSAVQEAEMNNITKTLFRLECSIKENNKLIKDK